MTMFSVPPQQHMEPFVFQAWGILLPKDWKDKSDSATTVYLESGDGTKGLYSMVVSGGPASDEQSSEKMIKAFQDAGTLSRESMVGYTWKKLSEHRKRQGNTIICLDDYYESQKHYRIRTLLMISPGKAVRIAFHDYDCKDLRVSDQYFQPLIASCHLR